MDSQRKLARRAGVFYLLAGIGAPFSFVYLPRTLIVAGDATATADHVRTSETLLRFGIANELVGLMAFIFAALALYRLFKDVSAPHAIALAALLLISIPISWLNVLNEIAALMFASDAGFLSAIGRPQLDAFSYLSLRLHSQGLILAQVFWGLWLFPFGVLVIRSGFIPRALGFILIVAGAAYVVSSFTSLLLPAHATQVARIATVLEAGELPMVLWLLIWGSRASTSGAQSPRSVDDVPARR